MTLMHRARRGEIPPSIALAAESEHVPPEKLRELVAAGRVVIPRNRKRRDIRPVAVGETLSIKVNANVGSSRDRADISLEMEKMRAAVAAGADAVMDLSTGGPIDGIRRAILAECPVPVGTVPLYQAAADGNLRGKSWVELTADDFFAGIEKQAGDGVDFMTVHCGVTRAAVRALVRPSSARDELARLQEAGAAIGCEDWSNAGALTSACAGASCVVSALQGLHDVIVDTQGLLLDAAVSAGVPRFIPSDYSIDFTGLPPGRNRNLDLRREFHEHLSKRAISVTTVFNGAFADMLTGQMPLVLFRVKRVLCWGNPDERMDFTTMDDTAAFTASAALDPSTPRFLRIAGDQLSARELAAVVSEVTGEKFRPFRAGGLGMLGAFIKVARTLAPGEKELFPPWQGMQYMRDMFDGRARLEPLDNDRYAGIRWTPAREVLARRVT